MLRKPTPSDLHLVKAAFSLAQTTKITSLQLKRNHYPGPPSSKLYTKKESLSQLKVMSAPQEIRFIHNNLILTLIHIFIIHFPLLQFRTSQPWSIYLHLQCRPFRTHPKSRNLSNYYLDQAHHSIAKPSFRQTNNIATTLPNQFNQHSQPQ